MVEMGPSGRGVGVFSGVGVSQGLVGPWGWYKCRMKSLPHSGDLLVCSPPNPDEDFSVCPGQRKLQSSYPSNAGAGRHAMRLSKVNLCLQK